MPLNVKGLPVFHREPDTSVFRMPDPEEVLYLQKRVKSLEREEFRYQDLDRECADLHEYSQLLEEELEENKRKVLAQAAQIERLEEELVKERQKRQRETDQLRLRLASVTEEVAQKEGLMGQMRSAASIVEDGVMEMRQRYDEILKRMADEIVASQTEVQRLSDIRGTPQAALGNAEEEAATRKKTQQTDSASEDSDNSSEDEDDEDYSEEDEDKEEDVNLGGSVRGRRAGGGGEGKEGKRRRVTVQQCLISQQSVRVLLGAVQRGAWFQHPSPLQHAWTLREGMLAFRHAGAEARGRARTQEDEEEEEEEEEDEEEAEEGEESSESDESEASGRRGRRLPAGMSVRGQRRGAANVNLNGSLALARERGKRRGGGGEGEREGGVGRDIRRLMLSARRGERPGGQELPV